MRPMMHNPNPNVQYMRLIWSWCGQMTHNFVSQNTGVFLLRLSFHLYFESVGIFFSSKKKSKSTYKLPPFLFLF